MWLKIFPFHVIPFQEYTFSYMKTQFFFGQKSKESLAYPKLKNLKLTLTKKSIALAKKFIQVFLGGKPKQTFWPNRYHLSYPQKYMGDPVRKRGRGHQVKGNCSWVSNWVLAVGLYADFG